MVRIHDIEGRRLLLLGELDLLVDLNVGDDDDDEKQMKTQTRREQRLVVDERRMKK